MPTAVENMITARDNLAARLAEVTASGAAKPTYTENGRSVSWTEYIAMLRQQLKELNGDIQAMQPFEVRTRMRP